MENFEKFASLSYTHSKLHHCCYNGSRAHENNDIEHGYSARGTYRSSEGGHYDGVANVVSYLDKAEMKEVWNNITASICRDHN